MKKSIVKIGFILGVLFLVDSSSSYAGELFQNQTRRLANNQNWIRLRKIYPSTRASKLLDKLGRRTTPTLSYERTSPYDSRLFTQEQLMARYQRDYARWESKAANIERRQRINDEKTKVRLAKKLESDKLRARRALIKEEERLAKVKAREERGSGGLFGRAFGMGSKKSEKQPSSEIVEEKSRKAEAFFGNVEEDVAGSRETPKKLGFFARLKKAMLGG